MRALSAFERTEILRRAADARRRLVDELARTIALEVGQAARRGARRGRPDPRPLLRVSAAEGARMHGETVPVDAAANGAGKLAFTIRQPCGVVVAITPFNYPALLVAHKIGPALAAGNAVVLKPARQTPLTGALPHAALLEAGLPGERDPVPHRARAPSSGASLCADPRVRKISFTGSTAVGEEITRVAGVKRLSLELGANCPLIVLPDADLDAVAAATATGGYVNAGQVCISVQRVLVARRGVRRLRRAAHAARRGPPDGPPARRADEPRPGHLGGRGDARRAHDPRRGRRRRDADHRAASATARSSRRASSATSTRRMRRSPAASCSGRRSRSRRVGGIDEAIALANDSDYGLGAGLFTSDLESALRFAREVDCGSIQINSSPLWRADPMPYGGLKGSGIGKEGPQLRVEEMTELKTVVFHCK